MHPTAHRSFAPYTVTIYLFQTGFVIFICQCFFLCAQLFLSFPLHLPLPTFSRIQSYCNHFSAFRLPPSHALDPDPNRCAIQGVAGSSLNVRRLLPSLSEDSLLPPDSVSRFVPFPSCSSNHLLTRLKRSQWYSGVWVSQNATLLSDFGKIRMESWAFCGTQLVSDVVATSVLCWYLIWKPRHDKVAATVTSS
jgi:hypothetical protein